MPYKSTLSLSIYSDSPPVFLFEGESFWSVIPFMQNCQIDDNWFSLHLSKPGKTIYRLTIIFLLRYTHTNHYYRPVPSPQDFLLNKCCYITTNRQSLCSVEISSFIPINCS